MADQLRIDDRGRLLVKKKQTPDGSGIETLGCRIAAVFAAAATAVATLWLWMFNDLSGIRPEYPVRDAVVSGVFGAVVGALVAGVVALLLWAATFRWYGRWLRFGLPGLVAVFALIAATDP